MTPANMREQAGRMEIGKPGSAEQNSLAALPAWQQAILVQIGINKGMEVTLGRRPPADARLIAAARVLAASQERHLQGRGPEQLGMLDMPLRQDVEVSIRRNVTRSNTISYYV